jgi:hypothetical protein
VDANTIPGLSTSIYISEGSGELSVVLMWRKAAGSVVERENTDVDTTYVISLNQ